MSTFPIVLYPQAIIEAQQASGDPQPFEQTAPPPPKPLPPPVNVAVILLEVAALGFLVAGLLAFDLGSGAWIVIGLGLAGMSFQVVQAYRHYPQVVQVYRRSVDFYQQAYQEYEQAKHEHERLEALKQIPGGLAQYRYEKGLSVLKKTRQPDGDQSNAPDGYSEIWFEHHLVKIFGDQIHNGLRISRPDWDKFYTPDFTFIDRTTSLHIDIEIDEPYRLVDQKPTHMRTKDLTRDNHILSYGWVVVRFAEIQTVKQPLSCCKHIADVIADLTGTVDYQVELESEPDLLPLPCWTWETAQAMAKENYRRAYIREIPTEFRPEFTATPPKPEKKISKTFKPSEYQQAIFDFITSGSGDGVVIAVAGSGKSTTLVEGAKRIRKANGIFLAFNQKIAKALGAKLGQLMEARTFNSLGLSIVSNNLGEVKVVADKYKTLALNHTSAKNAYMLSQLAQYARQALIDPTDVDALDALALHHNLAPSDQLLSSVATLLEEGKQLATERQIIDFADQVWLPVELDLPGPQYDFIFGDEDQDFNACQLEFLLRLRKPRGRLLLVGDPHQSIYGFAGADVDSVDKIIERLNPTILPLSICYRCPKKHIELAREIVPQVEPRASAPEGIIAKIPERKLAQSIRPGDLVISRTKAPLVKMSVSLLKKGIKAGIAGTDLGTELISLAMETSRQPQFQYQRFIKHLNALEDQKRSYLDRKPRAKLQIQELKDRFEALRYCYRFGDAETLDDFCAELKTKFKSSDQGLTLSTVHQAKGLEARRVFILKPENLPLKWEGQQDWELRQEMNLRYVALTRATDSLYFVES